MIDVISNDIQTTLFALQDEKYAAFQRKLLPGIDVNSVIGVRTPLLRSLAKQLAGTDLAEDFLAKLPHAYFDENQLHAFLVSDIKNFGRCVELLERFVPYIDNWATCDQLSPRCFFKHKTELLPHIMRWLESAQTYAIRLAIVMLMRHYLDDAFQPNHLAVVASVNKEEYYVKMAQSWYFATALAKHFDITVHFLQRQTLDVWTHNKTIQKAIESYRIDEEKKSLLKKMRR